jgi:2-hydroxychromene-2-carboxylate isomerase
VITAAGYDLAAAQPASGALQPAYRALDVARWAKLYKVPYRDHADVRIPDPRLLALACTAARRFDAGQVFARALMKAIFVDGVPVADLDLCARIANDAAGIEPALFQPMVAEAETASILDRTIVAAVAAGCFGVPSFVVHAPDGSTRMVFGNDRLVLLKQVIAEVKAAG